MLSRKKEKDNRSKDRSKSIIDAPSGMYSDEINLKIRKDMEDKGQLEHRMRFSESASGPVSQEARQKNWSRIANYFRANSMWMLMYCTGCCAIELPQAMTSRYDMERLGMGPMELPDRQTFS